MSLAGSMASTEAMRAVFDPRAAVQAMLDVEAALAEAGARTGLMSELVAETIGLACQADGIDLERLADEGAVAGTVVIPLVKLLKALVPEFGRGGVHVGGTSQDILDTALVMQLRGGCLQLHRDLAAMAEAAAGLARQYAGAKMLGRTLMQAAMPVTFGLKAANWLVAIDDSRRAITHAAEEALILQWGGAAGTMDVVGEKAMAFLEAMGDALLLRVAVTPWHTRRAPLLRLAAAVAGAVGVAGKIGTDIMLMMQSEIGEVAEPAAFGRGGSSAMAHKRNPTLSIAARSAAGRMPGYLAMLAGVQMQEHERAAGGWQAEAVVWPELMLCASGGLAAIAEALGGLQVFEDAMERNLAILPHSAIPEAVPHLIARALGQHEKINGELRK